MVRPEFREFEFTVVGTDNFHVRTQDRIYVDFTGSAMTTGYNFIKRRWLTSPVSRLVFRNPYTDQLKEMLSRLSGFQNVSFTTSGGEACDAALSRYGPTFIGFEGAYHGLTYLTRLVSNGEGIDRENRIVHLLYPSRTLTDDEAVNENERILHEAGKVLKLEGSSIILELIQSDGGINIMSSRFASYINEIVERYNMHLIVDEVYTAYGRSGELFLFKKYNLKPEMVCLGKGMAAGLPAGAVLYRGEWNLPYNGVISMSSMNMFIARIGIEVLKRLNRRVLRRVREYGKWILESLREVRNRNIVDIRGRGFMVGVEFQDEYTAYRVRDKLAEHGVLCTLVGSRNNVLKVTPPVLIDEETLKSGVEEIVNVLRELN